MGEAVLKKRAKETFYGLLSNTLKSNKDTRNKPKLHFNVNHLKSMRMTDLWELSVLLCGGCRKLMALKNKEKEAVVGSEQQNYLTSMIPLFLLHPETSSAAIIKNKQTKSSRFTFLFGAGA